MLIYYWINNGCFKYHRLRQNDVGEYETQSENFCLTHKNV